MSFYGAPAQSYVAAPGVVQQAGYVAQSTMVPAGTVATGYQQGEVCPTNSQTTVAYQQYEVQQPVQYQVQKVENIQMNLKHTYQVPIYTETQCVKRTYKGQPQLVGTDRGEAMHMGSYTQQPTQTNVGYTQGYVQQGGSYVVQGGANTTYAPVAGGAYSHYQ